jgi:hypothetical protein
MDLVNNSRTHALLQTKLKELGLAHAQVKFIKAEAPSPRRAMAPMEPAAEVPAAAATAPAPRATAPPIATARRDRPTPASVSAEEFKNDPLIQKALEIFKGQIVEVRA